VVIHSAVATQKKAGEQCGFGYSSKREFKQDLATILKQGS
jgi:hypothetical protein